jgi:hypothetical protein
MRLVQTTNFVCSLFRTLRCFNLSIHQLKGLILAQNERWRYGLGMQVARELKELALEGTAA